MKITTVPLFPDVCVIETKLHHDSRGHFFESFRKSLLEDVIRREINFVQENQSYSIKNVFRGFHFQIGKSAQSKLVRVIDGVILDVIVCLETGSHYSIELSSENRKQLFIPNNYAHGFLTLSSSATIQYKCDNYYDKDSERGINVYDSQLFRNLNFPNNMIVSDKDKELPNFSSIIL